MKRRSIPFSDVIASLTFASLPFRDLRFISFISLQDVFLSILFGQLLITPNKPKIASQFQVLSFFFSMILLLQSSLTAENVFQNEVGVIKTLIAYVVLPQVLYWYCGTYEKIKLLIYSFILGNSIANILILLGFQNIDSNGRESGFGGHPVFAGIANALCISLIFALQNKKKIDFLILVPAITLSIYGMTLAISSTAYIALLIGLIVVSFTRRRNFNTAIRLVYISLILSSALLIFLNLNQFSSARFRLVQSLNPVHSFTLTTGDNSTLLARLYSLKYSWSKIQTHLILGNGFDPEGKMTPIGLEPHNIFFIAWQAGGLLMLAFVTFLFFVSIRALIQASNQGAAYASVLICISWLTLLSGPALYDRSILAPLFLGILATRLKPSRATQ